jgi:hypothetical protein
MSGRNHCQWERGCSSSHELAVVRDAPAEQLRAAAAGEVQGTEQEPPSSSWTADKLVASCIVMYS